MWHSSAHLMAEAIEFYYPGVKLAIGPPIKNGFYYDVDFMDYSISEEDLEKIEQKMKELAKQKNDFVRKDISKAEAIAYFKERDDDTNWNCWKDWTMEQSRSIRKENSQILSWTTHSSYRIHQSC